ncbi:S-adenosylmethionine uptake transporter [Thiothrix eikelboomii]|uniref:S-adenosylmethionine uptake transporter n=1 Tax=Thiothrix eikelboomii TaxID=92487 RepID=A0A1T4WII0_9GAMM|nr:DMT family transporter [Thiothrix eikelboomii]SKA77144.1 S-adenosylmethionine uptake transporter [Thiothrix eikelboomii]
MTQAKGQAFGIQLMAFGVILLPAMDAAAKVMGDSIAAATIVLARFGFQSLFLLPFVWRDLYLPRGQELRLHLWRALGICVSTFCFFAAIQVMPQVDALAIFFTMPLLVTLLAPWMLGETIGWRRLSAVAVGMIGALIIIQPGQSSFGLVTVLPLIAALGFAFYLLFTRQLARTSSTQQGVAVFTMQFYSGVFGSLMIVLAIVLMQPFQHPAFEITWPEPWQWRQLILVGVLASIGHVVVTKAFQYADASVLAGFQYLELLSAAVLGWWLFGDLPTLNTWMGSAILVGSGLYIFHREKQAH